MENTQAELQSQLETYDSHVEELDENPVDIELIYESTGV